MPRSTAKSNGNALQGRALAILRLSRGMSRTELCRAARVSPGNLSEYERGIARPREENLTRLLDALDFSPEALERAEAFAQYPMGKDGTLPPDVRHDPDVSRKAALKLAQEVGKAFAHVTLAYLELRAGGWEEGGHGG
jgi:transcriptional regulator with XRE-family HTH domain